MYKINKSELFESLIEQNLFGEPFMLDLFGQTPDYEFDRDTKMDTDMSRDPYLKSQILVNINEVDKDSIKKIENDPDYFEKMIKAWAKKYDADWYYSTFYTDMEGNNVMIVFDEPTEDDVWQAEKYLAADGKKLKDIAIGDIVEVTNEKDAFYGCKGKVEDFFGKNNAQVFITYCPSNENVGNTEMILIKNLSKDKSSMMANGGGVMEMENGGELTDGELDMLNDYGFRIKEMQYFLNKKFPDSFQFRVFYPKGRAAELIPDYDRKIGGGLYGIQDENLKLMFPTDRRSAKSRSRGLIYRTYQGGENTYFDFVIIDKDYNEYIGTFGFKDDGDVDKEYITRFIAFLHEAYGYPFSVKHIVAKDGTTIAGLKIPNISVQAPKKIEKDSWDVSSKAIKKITMYKVEIVGGEGTLYFDNEKDAEKWYNKIKNFKNMSELYDVYFEEVENMFKKDQPSFKGYKQSPYKSYEIGSIMPFSAFQKIKPKTHLVLTYKNAGVDRKIDFIFDKIALDKAIGWLKFDDEWKYGDYIYDYEGNASFGSGASRLTLEKIVAKDGTTIAQRNKIAEVMHEFKEGKLKDRSGKVITNRKQAIAIALSASRKYNDGGYVTYDAISVATDEIDEMSDMEVADYLGIDVSEMNNEYRYDAIYKKAEEIMSESQYADGGFFGFGKSQYNTGRSWHLDRARYNKREKWEKPRAADGKKIDKRSSWHSDRRQYNKNEKWEKPLSKRKEVKIKVSLYNYGEFLRDEEIDLIDLPIRQLNSYELEGFNIREKDEDKYFYADDFYIDTDAEGTAIKYAYATKTKYAALGSKIGDGYNDKYMALSNCDIIHEYATKLDKMVSEDTELEEWVKMKMTRVEQNVAGVKHALEALSKYDDGGEIFKKQLLHIAKYAVEIKNLINGGTELMSWMEAKLAISAEYIDGVYHHLDYEMGNRAKNVGMPKRAKEEYAEDGIEIADDGFGILYSRNGKTYIVTADTEDQVELIEMALNDYRDGLVDREELENTLQSYMNDEQEVDLYDIIDIGGKPYIYDDFYGGQIELKSNNPINIDESTEIEFANGGGVGEQYSVWEIPRSGKPIKLYTGSMIGSKKFANKHKMSLKSGHGLETWPADTTEQEVARYSNSMTATSQQYAKGGRVKKRSLMSVAHLVVADWRKESIRDWYMKNYPTDDLGEELNDATFTDLWNGLNNKTDIYEIMGVGDSVIRERLFERLAEIYGVDYDVVYKKWVGYANGGDVAARGKIIVTKINDIPNLMEELNAGRVTYRGLGMGKLYNDFYEIANESGTRIKVKGKEYYITDTDFRKLNWDDKKKEWKNLIRFSAPQRGYENGGGVSGEYVINIIHPDGKKDTMFNASGKLKVFKDKKSAEDQMKKDQIYLKGFTLMVVPKGQEYRKADEKKK